MTCHAVRNFRLCEVIFVVVLRKLIVFLTGNNVSCLDGLVFGFSERQAQVELYLFLSSIALYTSGAPNDNLRWNMCSRDPNFYEFRFTLQTAIYFFTETSPKRFGTREKLSSPLRFRNGYLQIKKVT